MNHDKYQSCIDACIRCAQECEYCAIACVSEEGTHSLAQCIKLDMECAKICWLAASFLASDSNFAVEICEVCATICNSCAMECEKHKDMEHCRRCAEYCFTCAGECIEMSGLSV